MYVVILAGGGGTRLWPLSRPETPKPFLPLLGDESLLQRTVARVVEPGTLGIGMADVTVVTDRRYAAMVRTQCPGVRVIAEPAGRNTAAAIALATLTVDRPEDEVMCVLPADHLIKQESRFRDVLADAADLAGGSFGVESPLVTLGVQVARPATDYGYLLPDVGAAPGGQGGQDGQGGQGGQVGRGASLRAFEEKPTRDRAIELQQLPGVAWNAGIFLWRRRAIRRALERYTGLVTLLEPVIHSETGVATAYEQAPSISIDHAVMERAARDHQVVMTAMDAGWSDLGSWTALIEAIGGQGTGAVIQVDEPAEAGPNDLIVERVNGRLILTEGPRGILATTPTALLRDAAPAREAVQALVDRIRRWEEPS